MDMARGHDPAWDGSLDYILDQHMMRFPLVRELRARMTWVLCVFAVGRWGPRLRAGGWWEGM